MDAKERHEQATNLEAVAVQLQRAAKALRHARYLDCHTGIMYQVRTSLVDRLKADGWRVTIPNNNYRVLPPTEKRRKG